MCIRSGSFAKLLRRPFHDFLHCTLYVTQGHQIENIRPTGPPVRGVTSTSNLALWPCTFCSDRSPKIELLTIKQCFLRQYSMLLHTILSQKTRTTTINMT